MRLRRFGAPTRNEPDPQSRITCRHPPAARRTARPPVPSRKRVRHGPDPRRGGLVVLDIVGSMRLLSRRLSCTGECQMAIMETKPPIPRAILVGVQIPGVDDVAHAASIEELGRLVMTLGYEVAGTLSQKRDAIDGGSARGGLRNSRRLPAGRASSARWHYPGSQRRASASKSPTGRSRTRRRSSLI